MSTERITQYNQKDLSLVKSKTIFTNFGKGKHTDHVELHVYSGENVLESNYNVKSYNIDQKETGQIAPSIKLAIHSDIRSMGYQSGTFGIKYNFLRCLVGDPNNNLYIDEISNDRREIRVRPIDDDLDLSDDFLEFGERIEGSELSSHTFWPDIRLNFGEDTLLLAVNWGMDYDAYPNFPHSMVFKLYEPLPDELEDGDKFWICQSIAEPIQEDIKLTTEARGFSSNTLAPPDFSIPAQFDPPKPTGYKILIALPEPDEKTDGGIIKASQTIHTEEVGSIVGFVLDMGPDVYSDSARFPTGSFCKKGDWIVMRSYTGTRFMVHGKEFRLINDDSVEAVVEDPRGIVKI